MASGMSALRVSRIGLPLSHTLAIAIDTVRDWLTDKDKLQLALGRIQSLEAQLKNSDEVVKRFQDRALAANQVHSRD